jgi:hypothetical protein
MEKEKKELRRYYIAYKNPVTSFVLNFDKENNRNDWIKWYKNNFISIAKKYESIYSLELYNLKENSFDIIAYDFRIKKGPGTLEEVDRVVNQAYLKAEKEGMTPEESESFMNNFVILYSIGKINRTHLLKPMEYALLKSDTSIVSQKLFNLFVEGILNMNSFCEHSMFTYEKESYGDLDKIQAAARKYKTSEKNLSGELLDEIEKFINKYKNQASYKSYRDMISYLYKTEQDSRREIAKRR